MDTQGNAISENQVTKQTDKQANCVTIECYRVFIIHFAMNKSTLAASIGYVDEKLLNN